MGKKQIWTDEPSSTLFPTSAHNVCCQLIKHGGESVIVWAAISWASLGLMISLHGCMTFKENEHQRHPMVQTLFPHDVPIFQDDNSSTDTDGFMYTRVYVKHLPWPPQSLDLNIIESSMWKWHRMQNIYICFNKCHVSL
uniref:Uncharacterized protein n=1 Tax=Esox lucius TaxID=8010 RepID=A0AAY5KS67_ESOLU